MHIKKNPSVTIVIFPLYHDYTVYAFAFITPIVIVFETIFSHKFVNFLKGGMDIYLTFFIIVIQWLALGRSLKNV